MARGAPNRKANIWVARIIPVVLIGIIGYGSWVVTKLICIDYLLHPPPSSIHPQVGPAVAILVIYYLLLIPVLVAYARLIQTIITNPGYVPRGAQWYVQKAEKESDLEKHHHKRRQRSKSFAEKTSASNVWPGRESSRNSAQSNLPLTDDQQPRVEDFWLKDVFICNYDGRPAFCSSCLNFKPDRTHHCSEVNRCVRKMDHFCPWVGGIVSETSFKSFIQFCFYAALFCLHNLVFISYYFAQRRRQDDYLTVHWVLALAFAGLFLLFSAGMFASTLQLAMINSTTVENLSRRTKVWYLAVWMPRPEEVMSNLQNTSGKTLRTISYPRPAEEQQILLQQSGGMPVASPTRFQRHEDPSSSRSETMPARVFAILESPRGFNPWDLGALDNVRQVLGYNILDWFLPMRRSPCASHTDGGSMFKLGSQVQRLKEDAGLVPGIEPVAPSPEPAHRKKRRRHRSGEVSDDDRKRHRPRRHSRHAREER